MLLGLGCGSAFDGLVAAGDLFLFLCDLGDRVGVALGGHGADWCWFDELASCDAWALESEAEGLGGEGGDAWVEDGHLGKKYFLDIGKMERMCRKTC